MNGKEINITPKIYIHSQEYNPNAVTNYVRTIFKFTSPNTNLDYISASYKNYILLGRTFMKEYYTVFDSQAKQIKLYVATSFPPSVPRFQQSPPIPTPSDNFQICMHKCHEKEALFWQQP